MAFLCLSLLFCTYHKNESFYGDGLLGRPQQAGQPLSATHRNEVGCTAVGAAVSLSEIQQLLLAPYGQGGQAHEAEVEQQEEQHTQAVLDAPRIQSCRAQAAAGSLSAAEKVCP